jgi:hypothetical protein
MKWIIGIVLALTVLVVGYFVYQTYVVNPRAVAELRDHPDGDRARLAALITLPDGRTIPVNYLREADTVYVGADGAWWRQLRGGAVVALLIRGETLSGQANPIENDQQYTTEVFARLRPNAPAWLPDWLNGVLVVINLDSATRTSEVHGQ